MRKSPEKSFVETDKYTIKLPSGNRSLLIESTLAQTESDFLNVLRRIRPGQRLNAVDRACLCTFTAAMQARTIRKGEHWKHKNEHLHDTVVVMEKAHAVEPHTSLQTKNLVDYAHQHIIAMAITQPTPLLFQMPMTIITTDDEDGFITSDAPCVWFNPKLHTFPPFYRYPGLAQKDIEVTMPLTPHHLLLMSHTEFPPYQGVAAHVVVEFNRGTRHYCTDEFVPWKGTLREIWFNLRKKPDDCLEDTEEGKRALAELAQPE